MPAGTQVPAGVFVHEAGTGLIMHMASPPETEARQACLSDVPLDVPLSDKVRALQSPDAWPHATGSIEIIETHFAWVFLAGDYAYKLKKIMGNAAMTHQSLAVRRQLCERELHLNRRLAPTIYLDVVPLTMDSNRRMRIDAAGDAVDWLIRMRRLERNWFLDRNWHSPLVNADTLQRLILMLVEFYQRQSPEQWDVAAYCNRLKAQVNDNERELTSPELGLSSEIIRTLTERQRKFMEQSAQLLGQRALGGKIIEVHGDLRPEHIYLGTPMCVIDCLEFDRDLRLMDPLEELAFLLVECSVAGAAWIGHDLIAAYQRLCNDNAPDALLNFYVSHRAATRAKIVAWHLLDPQFRDRADWRAIAGQYLHLALSHLATC